MSPNTTDAGTKARPRTFDPNRAEGLARFLEDALSAARVEITDARLLSGGAVQENWRIDVAVGDGPRAGRHTWVLRTDAAARIAVSLDRATEYAVISVAHAAGVPVAEPIVRCDDAGVIGAPFMIQGFVSGVAQARRVVRDPALAGTAGDLLAEQLGRALAQVHAIDPSAAGRLAGLQAAGGNPAQTQVALFRRLLDGASEARPALEHILCWLHDNAPKTDHVCLVHGDFRTGNYLVEEGRLSAVLDWEFAHWGDPHEDIGWLTASCWRFGAIEREAGGVGSREALYRGYDAHAAGPLDRDVVGYWEIMAAAKWATIAVLQGDRFRTGGEPSLELALTGLMPPEMELEALDGIRSLRSKGWTP